MSEFGEKASVAKPEDPEKYLKVKVLEVDFSDSFKVINNKKEVIAPHWPCGKYNFNYSEKPAVMKFGQASKASIKVKVDSKGISGNGVLKGTIKGYVFEGKLSLSSGEKTVSVTLSKSPEDLQYLKGTMIWEAEGGGVIEAAGTSFVELFFIFDDPSKLEFFEDGVWAEALRYVFENSIVKGKNIEKEAVVEVTKLCFNIKYHEYDIIFGASSFGGGTQIFELTKYILPKYLRVNCYDQTYAVVVFSGALGLPIDGLYMNPYGFLKQTQLVGWGQCNNPFPSKKFKRSSVVGSKEEDYLLVANDDPDREPFGNHMFCEYDNEIFDACAGPYLGKGDRNVYVFDGVDSKTSNNLYSRYPGGVSDIQKYELANIPRRGVYDLSVVKVE